MDRLRLLRSPLPLEGEFQNIWSKIEKVIDPLHVKNHKGIYIYKNIKFLSFTQRPECKVIYAPAKVAVKYPEANLMIAEQTFAWMGKFI